MNFPGRSQRGPDVYEGVARSEQVKPEGARHGVVDDGNVAWPERVDLARRSWLEASPDDFEKIGRRTYRDRGSGIELTAVRGAPLLSVGNEESRGIACFFIEGGRLTFLRRVEFEAILGPQGFVIERRVETGSAPPVEETHIW